MILIQETLVGLLIKHITVHKICCNIIQPQSQKKFFTKKMLDITASFLQTFLSNSFGENIGDYVYEGCGTPPQFCRRLLDS